MRQLPPGVVILAILLLGGCAQIGQPAPIYSTPGTLQQIVPGDSGERPYSM
jgi:hypothetical protein